MKLILGLLVILCLATTVVCLIDYSQVSGAFVGIKSYISDLRTLENSGQVDQLLKECDGRRDQLLKEHRIPVALAALCTIISTIVLVQGMKKKGPV